MNKKTLLGAALLLVSLAPRAQQATFSYFSYQGDEPRFRKQIDTGREFFNPILAGFYPDPSICRVGDTYYMVNSSFSFFPRCAALHEQRPCTLDTRRSCA